MNLDAVTFGEALALFVAQESGDLAQVENYKRVLAGAEVGHYWILDHRQIVDVSAYGKFVDNVSQQFSSILVSLGPQSISVTGIGESRYGADAGSSASLSIGSTARLYFNYDGKFRSNLTSHQGTLGFEIRF